MSFLRRLFGGTDAAEDRAAEDRATEDRATEDRAAEDRAAERPATAAELEEAERQYELEVARGEARRLSELQQRQLKYADKSWTPPRQGGERRADDEDAERPAD